MNTVDNLIMAIGGLFSVGCVYGIVKNAISIMLSPENRPEYLKKIKNLIIAFVIGTTVAFSPVIKDIIERIL